MSSESNSSNSPTHEEISTRARRLWENAGSPADRDLEFWLEAEAGLRRDRESQQTRPVSSATNEPAALKQPQAQPRSGNRRR